MKKMLISTLLVCLAAFQGAQAVPVVFNGTPGSSVISATFPQDVTFTITKASATPVLMFIIEDVMTSPDGNYSQLSGFSQSLSFSVNGGADQQINYWIDHTYAPSGFWGDSIPNDVYFTLWPNTTSFIVGDTVTLHAGTMTSGGIPGSDFQLGASGNYSMFLADNNGQRISDAIPEPASVMMIALGGFVIVGYRRFFGRV